MIESVGMKESVSFRLTKGDGTYVAKQAEQRNIVLELMRGFEELNKKFYEAKKGNGDSNE